MAREYIKLPNGTLQEIDRARVREFASVECVKKAIADGDLQPGDTWATICHTTPITEDIAAEVYRILSYVPETTNSTDNQLLNHCDLTAEMEEIAKCAMCCDFQAYVETAGVAITDRVCCSDYNAYTTANDACMACRVQCCDFTAFQTSNTAAINAKVSCTDYNTCVGNMQNAITTLEGKPGLDCIGNVTSTDIANFITMADVNACNYTTMAAVNACGYTTMTAVNACVACLVQCSDFTSFQTSNTTIINTKVTCTDYNTCVACLRTDVDNLATGSVTWFISGNTISYS